MTEAREREGERRDFAMRIEVIRQIASTIRYTIGVGGFCWLAWMGYKSVAALAGKATSANIMAAVGVSEWLTIAVVSVLVAGNIGQARLRKWSTARLTDRIKDLELQLDPDRSSSKLLPDGSTRPEDL